MQKQLNIALPNAQYPIVIDSEKFDFSALESWLVGKKIMLVSNEVVAPLYLEEVRQCFVNNVVHHCLIGDGETHKNQESWLAILNALAEHQFNRSDVLVSLGGGIVCDITGFAAASWMRGMAFIQVPTTLLSQIDASVGGKTGINHVKGKNMIGAFHQPKAVIINARTLRTLPQREFNAGIGEAIKYAGINQAWFYEWLVTNQQAIKHLDEATLMELITHCCQFKTKIVEEDEKEQGVRALLNLGHTFGHAIETVSQYKYLHGEAVALGMVMAAELSAQLGYCAGDIRKMLENLLQAFELPIMLDIEYSADEILALMKADKKVINDQHRLILLKGMGEAFIAEGVNDANILKAINTCIT
ncbi:MAG: 3-dehydroquinate synthase [Marinicella sp.]